MNARPDVGQAIVAAARSINHERTLDATLQRSWRWTLFTATYPRPARPLTPLFGLMRAVVRGSVRP
jgi:hypothetical protein